MFFNWTPPVVVVMVPRIGRTKTSKWFREKSTRSTSKEGVCSSTTELKNRPDRLFHKWICWLCLLLPASFIFVIVVWNENVYVCLLIFRAYSLFLFLQKRSINRSCPLGNGHNDGNLIASLLQHSLSHIWYRIPNQLSLTSLGGWLELRHGRGTWESGRHVTSFRTEVIHW